MLRDRIERLPPVAEETYATAPNDRRAARLDRGRMAWPEFRRAVEFGRALVRFAGRVERPPAEIRPDRISRFGVWDSDWPLRSG